MLTPDNRGPLACLPASPVSALPPPGTASPGGYPLGALPGFAQFGYGTTTASLIR